MKTYRGVDVEIHTFLTSALVGGEWSASLPCRFTPGIHFIGGRVDPRAGLDDMEKWKFFTLPGLELLPPGRPARSQSLYRLSYPGSLTHLVPRLIMREPYLHSPMRHHGVMFNHRANFTFHTGMKLTTKC
jgi:hypothetical protein